MLCKIRISIYFDPTGLLACSLLILMESFNKESGATSCHDNLVLPRPTPHCSGAIHVDWEIQASLWMFVARTQANRRTGQLSPRPQSQGKLQTSFWYDCLLPTMFIAPFSSFYLVDHHVAASPRAWRNTAQVPLPVADSAIREQAVFL